jgi:hypothetical protein
MCFIIHSRSAHLPKDDLWAGVGLKLRHAEFFLHEMSRSLQPPPMNAVQQSAGTTIDTGWQQSFYAYLDAFLAMARSIPEIIQSCFGEDRSKPMAAWFDALDDAEKERRRAFSSQFEPAYKCFREHPLSKARNIGFHRTGYSPAEVRIAGRFGVEHIGSAIEPVPAAESRPLGHIGDDPALQWAATQPPLPVRPMWSDFTIDGKPLFTECRAYLTVAETLAAQARSHCQRMHGSNSLTPPPA